MNAIHAIYKDGVLSPVGRVDAPPGSEVMIEAEEISAQAECDSLDEIYRIMGESYDSGETDVAERHNEHQP